MQMTLPVRNACTQKHGCSNKAFAGMPSWGPPVSTSHGFQASGALKSWVGNSKGFWYVCICVRNHFTKTYVTSGLTHEVIARRKSSILLSLLKLCVLFTPHLHITTFMSTTFKVCFNGLEHMSPTQVNVLKLCMHAWKLTLFTTGNSETRVGMESLEAYLLGRSNLSKQSTYTLSRSFFSILADELVRRGLQDFKNQEVKHLAVLDFRSFASCAECCAYTAPRGNVFLPCSPIYFFITWRWHAACFAICAESHFPFYTVCNIPDRQHTLGTGHCWNRFLRSVWVCKSGSWETRRWAPQPCGHGQYSLGICYSKYSQSSVSCIVCHRLAWPI